MVLPKLFFARYLARHRALLLAAGWLLAGGLPLGAQPAATYRPALDVLHYHLSLDLTDASDRVAGEAELDIHFREPVEDFVLDLVAVGPDGRGMEVTAVWSEEEPLPFQQRSDSLILTSGEVAAGTRRTYRIEYGGTPRDGLIIGRNKYGNRTFFADNWPDRARHWFPAVDHPSDKATVAFTVRVPNQYQVVANGSLVEETDLPEGRRVYRYATRVPLPTKVMVVGAAGFAIQYLGEVQDIPLSSWVYPEDRAAGFYDFAQATRILDYFIDKVGPYPFLKLANVQSSTRFGGMENAGNIFYSENAITGRREAEALLAHEIAHQWFGNSASEADWPHFWLSEGFATYLTNLYLEHTYGRDALVARVKGQRETVLEYHARRPAPVVDTATRDYMQLLNPNSYQKGAWVLHMLRHRLGDDRFWETVRTYYDRFALGNATTADFQAVAEEVSGQDLARFFEQWLFTAGHPVLRSAWTYAAGAAILEVEQLQEYTFQFPLEVRLFFADGRSRLETLQVGERLHRFELDAAAEPLRIELDPGAWLLYAEAK